MQKPILAQPSAQTNWRSLVLPLAAAAVVFVLWQSGSSILYPFRLLVTFVHETGHGLTAIITGGNFLRFVVYENGGGVATTAGGNPFFVLQMGYLGAALFGAGLFYLTNRTAAPRWVALGLGVFFIACAVFYTASGAGAIIGAAVVVGLWLLSMRWEAQQRVLRWLVLPAALITLIIVRADVAVMIGLVAGALLLALSAYGSQTIIGLSLNVLAMMIGFNAINDIRFLLGSQEAVLGGVPNDALAIARYTNLPPALWILIWVVLSIAMMGAAGYFALRSRLAAQTE